MVSEVTTHDDLTCPAAYLCRHCHEVTCVICGDGQPDCAHGRDLCADCRRDCAECRADAREDVA